MNKKSLRLTRTPVYSKNNVIGLVHPYRMDYKVFGNVPEGTTLYKAMLDACKAANIRKALIEYAIIQVGKRDNENQTIKWEFIPFTQWKKRKLQKDELLRFRILPKSAGGGGGKTNSFLMIGVMVLAIAAAAAVAGPLATAMAWGKGMTMFASGLAGLATLTVGSLLVNAIAPVPRPSLGNFNTGRQAEADVYSISAGRNQVKQWQRVPVPVGQGRFAPPLAASPYTRLYGEDQYLHQLFCLGIGDMEISDIKIGATPISKYNDCLWEIMTYDPNNPTSPKYYPTGVMEDNLNVQLKYNVANTRNTYECDYAEIDLSFNGLCKISDRGDTESESVSFMISYRKFGQVNTEQWVTVSESRFYNGSLHRLYEWEGRRQGIIGVTWDGGPVTSWRENLHNVEQSYLLQLGYYQNGIVYPRVETDRFQFSGFELEQRGDHVWINSGTIRRYTTGLVDTQAFQITVTGAQTRLLRKSFRIDFPSRGIYEVSVKRITADPQENKEGNKIRNDSYWYSLKSMSHDRPVKTTYPVMLLSLQIKASGQLSGTIDSLTVFYKTRCYDFDYASSSWGWRYTSNPAMIFKYILQQRNAFSQPQDDSLLDHTSIIEAGRFAYNKGFTYNKVFDGSSSVFERLQSVCASMLASPTMIDGKWGIIVDRPRDNVVCAFTSANAWQWSFERQQVRLPQAIHCNFVNEETWESDMRIVYTDEPQVGEYIHETQDYEGVTNPAQVFQLARFHYADAKMRRRLIHFRCFDESILCTRGDLVELACPNINVTGLQVGRVRKIIRNDLGQITGVDTDQLNTVGGYERSWGVKIYSDSGQVYHIQCHPTYTSERKLVFSYPQAIDIQEGNKYAFGDYNEEVFQAVVLSMKFNTDWTCDITCQDYTPAIYDDLSKPIPEWKSIITRPLEFKWTISSIPIVVGLVSNESALLQGPSGALFCRILVYVNDPLNLDSRAAHYDCEMRQIYNYGTSSVFYGDWRLGAKSIPISQSYFYIDDVDEGKWYQLRVRYSGLSGEVGDWTPIYDHQIVGKTNPPSNVTGFVATIDNPRGIKLTWTPNWELDISYYEISGAVFERVQFSPQNEKIYSKTGNIAFDIVAVDTGGRRSINKATASVDVLSPPMVSFIQAHLLDDGVVASWYNLHTTWDIDYVRLKCKDVMGVFSNTTGTLLYTGKFEIGTRVYALAKDIFDNWGYAESSREVTVYAPLTPRVKIGFNKLTGMIVLDWQDCRNNTLSNTPQISHYEIWGTLADNDPMIITGTHYESIVPLKVYERGSTNLDGIEVNVGNVYIRVNAVDKYGITSRDAPNYVDNAISFSIYPPKNPIDFGVSASLSDGTNLQANWTQSTAIMLTWADCERTFAIDYYTVYDEFTQTNYKVATNYIVLSARKEGFYPITVKAVDILGQESSAMTYNLEITGVGGLAVKGKIDGSDILLEWNTPSASFQIDHYIVFEDNDDLPTGKNEDQARAGYIGQAKFNYFRVPAREIGTKTYYVWAVDVAGNINTSFANYVSVTITALPSPIVNAELQGDGVGLSWNIANRPATTLPPVAWEIRRYEMLHSADEISQKTPLDNYGQVSASKYKANAFRSGEYTFAIRAIDSGGNFGEWGLCAFYAVNPGQVTFVNSVVIDNNVQLYWTAPNKVFFPIAGYIFEEIDKDTDIAMFIGTVDALFASDVKEVAGEYTYAITPLDVGGNRGVSSKITLRLSQPPDFVFYDQKESLFNGIKENMVLDGHGHMLGPVPLDETWAQNIERATDVAGHEIITFQDKIDDGWGYWLEPALSSGVYSETIDHGTLVPSTNYKVTLGYIALSGSPEVACKVELSDDGDIWRVASDNATTLYVTQFRYSRITLTITGGYVQFNNITIRLDVKKLTDFGSSYCKASDNGDGWLSELETPMLTGTWIPFKVSFVDVQSLPKPNVINNDEYTAFSVFEDVINPKGFRIFVKDKNGNRVDANVSWVAMGV